MLTISQIGVVVFYLIAALAVSVLSEILPLAPSNIYRHVDGYGVCAPYILRNLLLTAVILQQQMGFEHY